MKYMQYESIHTSSPHKPHTSCAKTRAAAAPIAGSMRCVWDDNFICIYIWETGCKTSTTIINKNMNEKSEYNKRTYTKTDRERERERERACGQKEKKEKPIFFITG